MPRFFISGPVSNLLPEQAKANFFNMEVRLKTLFPDAPTGSIFNPYDYFWDFTRPETDFLFERVFTPEGVANASWEDLMDVCLHILMRGEFNYLVMLNNWENSRGARIERALSIELPINVIIHEFQIMSLGILAFPPDRFTRNIIRNS